MEWSCLRTGSNQKVFISHATHASAALTPRPRLRLARLIVELGWSIPRAAERYDVSWRTAKKWADRYRYEGPAGMCDRCSRRTVSPNAPQPRVVRKIVHLRWKQRLGPVEIGDRLGMPAPTVHAVLVRCQLNRPTRLDRADVGSAGARTSAGWCALSAADPAVDESCNRGVTAPGLSRG